jgi:hypothetical protein
MAATIVMSLPNFFINCIKCFEVIQYGSNLDIDRDTLVLRLHYIGLSLSRWGTSKGIIGDNIHVETINPQLEECRPMLESILARFNEAQRKSAKFKLSKQRSPEAGTILELGETTESATSSFRKATKDLMHKYATKYGNAVTRTKWAIYERKILENLVSNLRSDVDDLTAFFPGRSAVPVEDLIAEEMSEFEDAALPVLRLISYNEEDTIMEEAVASEMNKREERGHTFEDFDIEGLDGLQFQAGDEVGFRATRSGGGSAYTNFKIRGSGKVHTGNKFHGEVHTYSN